MTCCPVRLYIWSQHRLCHRRNDQNCCEFAQLVSNAVKTTYPELANLSNLQTLQSRINALPCQLRMSRYMT